MGRHLVFVVLELFLSLWGQLGISSSEWQVDGDTGAHGAGKCTNPQMSGCPHFHVNWPEHLWPGKKNPLGKGTGKNRISFPRYSHGQVGQPTSLRGTAESLMKLKEILFLSLWVTGGVSVQWTPRSTHPVSRCRWKGTEYEIKPLESVSEKGGKSWQPWKHTCKSTSGSSPYWYPRRGNSSPPLAKGQGELVGTAAHLGPGKGRGREESGPFHRSAWNLAEGYTAFVSKKLSITKGGSGRPYSHRASPSFLHNA